MKHPYAAYQLAKAVLDGVTTEDPPRFELSTGAVEVNLNIQGMVHQINKRILLHNLDLADQLTAEIKRQTSKLNITRLVQEHVAKIIATAVESIQADVEDEVRDTFDRLIKSAVYDQVEVIRERVIDQVRATLINP